MKGSWLKVESVQLCLWDFLKHCLHVHRHGIFCALQFRLRLCNLSCSVLLECSFSCIHPLLSVICRFILILPCCFAFLMSPISLHWFSRFWWILHQIKASVLPCVTVGHFVLKTAACLCCGYKTSKTIGSNRLCAFKICICEYVYRNEYHWNVWSIQ